MKAGPIFIGFKSALTRCLNDYLKKLNLSKKLEENLSGEDVREGLTAVISIKVPEPQFEGQTKARLGNSEVKGIVESLTYDRLTLFFDENPDVVKKILDKSIMAAKAREAARKARELTRKKGLLENSGLPGSLLTVRKRTRISASCISWKGTRREEAQSREGTGRFRPSFPCGARC